MSNMDSVEIGQKKATIYDIAEKTGFSSGTVSRVLNNRTNVAAATRDLILQTARDLNLKPKLSTRTRQVAIISDPANEDILEGYTESLTSRLARALSRDGVAVVFPNDPVEELPKLFLEGVIALNCVSDFSDFLLDLESRIPVLYLDRLDMGELQCGVCSDHYQAGVLAAEYFASRGKTKLAFFAQDTLPHQERLRGFSDGIEKAGLVSDPFRLILKDRESRMASIARIVRSNADAIYIPGASYQAVECLHLLTYVMGVRVPEDISIIGGENEGLSGIMSPPLTTIEEPLQAMANKAASMMNDLIEGRELESKAVKLPVRLIERNSV